MPDNKNIKNKKNIRNRKNILILFISIGIIFISALIIYFYFFMKSPEINVVLHGTKSVDMDYSESVLSARLKDGMEKILMTDEGFLTSDFTVEWIEGNTNFTNSEYILFSDQIELLSFYVRQNDRKSFNKLYNSINEKFKDERGFFAEKIYMQSQKIVPSAEILISEQIMYTRVLLEGYSVFKNVKYFNLADTISNAILPLCAEDNMVPANFEIALPPPPPTPDFAATPTPKPEITPIIPLEDIRYINVTDISRIDLYALKLLTQIDEGWFVIYQNAFDIMKNSYLSGDFSYYRPAYDTTAKSYIPFKAESPLFVTTDQLRIMLSLAEVGEVNYPAYSYIKQMIMNFKILYSTYQIPSGTPGTQNQSLEGYALMAKLARIMQDEQVYEICVEKIFWNTANSTTSPIFGLIFQNESETVVKTYAGYVITALNSLY